MVERVGQEQLEGGGEAGLVEGRRPQLEQEPAQPQVRLAERLAGLQGHLALGRVRELGDQPVQAETGGRHGLRRVVVDVRGDAPARLLLDRDELRDQPRLLALAALDLLGGDVEGVGDVGELREAARHRSPGAEVARAEPARGLHDSRGPALEQELRGEVAQEQGEREADDSEQR